MALCIRDHDWAATPLGPAADWPASLRVMVETMVSAPYLMMLGWGPGLVMLYNDACAPCLGDRHSCALGLPLAEGWPEGWPLVDAMTRQAFAGGSARSDGVPLRITRSGRREDTWWDIAISPVWDDAHAVAGMLAVMSETTARVLDRQEREQAHRRLRESEARHRLLIGSWAQAVWETDADGVVVVDSPSWRTYTGQSLEGWLGYGWLDAIHPDDRDYAERQWRDVVRARGLVNAEFRLRDPGGGWRWTNVRAAPVLDAASGIEKWAGMNIDIDAQKRAEALLREADERRRAELESQIRERTAQLQANRDLLQATMNASTDMIQVFEAVRNDAGGIVDFRWMLNNHTSEKLYGEIRGESLLKRNPGVVTAGISTRSGR